MSRMLFSERPHEGSLCRARRDRGVSTVTSVGAAAPTQQSSSGDHCARAVQPRLVWQVRAHAATGRSHQVRLGHGDRDLDVARGDARRGGSNLDLVTTLEKPTAPWSSANGWRTSKPGNGASAASIGAWKVVRGTGQYARVTGGEVVDSVVVERTRSLVRPPRRPAQRSVSAARDGAACARASPRRGGRGTNGRKETMKTWTNITLLSRRALALLAVSVVTTSAATLAAAALFRPSTFR